MSRGRVSLVPAFAVTLLALATAARAQERPPAGGLFEAVLPGGISAALAAIDDPGPADRSHFLVDVIRRIHASPESAEAAAAARANRALVQHLRTAPASGARDSVPLPLPPRTWIDAVFGGRGTEAALVPAILESRGAALLYCGLLHLDDATREWLAGEPDLLGDLASPRAAAVFLVASPGLRVRTRRMVLPGGMEADPIWEALADAEVDRPAEFVRRVLDRRGGRFAYFLGALSQLSAGEIRYALKLDRPDAGARIAAAKRLLAVFESLGAHWSIEDRPFWRPALDPALLLKDLDVDERGRPALPGTQRFWRAVFRDLDLGTGRPRNRRVAADTLDDPVDFVWLCEEVFSEAPSIRARLHKLVLFASRNVGPLSAEALDDAEEAVRASARFPALAIVLERAGLDDLRAFAAAARRAERLSAIEDARRASRSLLQFQGALALLSRAAVRGGLSRESLAPLVTSLSSIDVSDQGDYEGRLVRWFEDQLLQRTPAASAEEALVALLAGTGALGLRYVDWEGTRYRVDLPASESARLTGLLDGHARPFISVARTLAAAADALDTGAPNRERLRTALETAIEAGDAFDPALLESLVPGYGDLVSALRRRLSDREKGAGARSAREIRLLADGFLGAALLEFAYAVALGQPGGTPISLSEAAGRHEFALRRSTASRRIAWLLPEPAALGERGWHVEGSLLGLDVRLAEFSLVRISSRPPIRKPSLNETDRRVFTEAIGLVDPDALQETDRAAMLHALRAGRARVAVVRSLADALALADEAGIGAARRALLAWTVVHDPDRVPHAFSLAELVALGDPASATRAVFDPWGAPGEPRFGCLCLRLGAGGGSDVVAGRWHSGMVAGDFPDLNLRLSELLDELGMPAVLLAPVLAPATMDLVENATSRHHDDRRGLVDFVRALSRERVEEYLALLTTDGPLVPVGAADSQSHMGNRR